jgi:hypothetical protein
MSTVGNALVAPTPELPPEAAESLPYAAKVHITSKTKIVIVARRFDLTVVVRMNDLPALPCWSPARTPATHECGHCRGMSFWI